MSLFSTYWQLCTSAPSPSSLSVKKATTSSIPAITTSSTNTSSAYATTSTSTTTTTTTTTASCSSAASAINTAVASLKQRCLCPLCPLLRALLWVAFCLFSWQVLTGCASDDLPAAEVRVSDPVSFRVEGISGDLRTNVEAHLNSLAVISKKRVMFFVREITESSTQALRAYGYYHPKIDVQLPDKDNESDRTVVVQVDAGKPLFIRNYTLQILGEGSEYKAFDDALKQSPLGAYTILNHGLYEDLKQKIHEQALSLGFFDGKFISSRILVYQDQNMADIELIYDSGPRYRFGQFLMDDDTKKLIIPSKNLQKFKQGDYFSTQIVNAYVQALNQTGYYNAVDVRPAVDKRKDQEVPLEVHLERRPNNNVRLGVGYTTDEGPRFLVEWNKPLLNDRGDSFTSMATITPITQDAQAVYKIPLKDPNLDYLTLNAMQNHVDLNDTEAVLSQIGVHYIANETGSWRRDYSIMAEYEDYNQASESGYASNLLPGLRLTRRESSGGFDPARGYSLMLEALGTSKLWGDNTFVQVRALYRGIISITENSRFLFRLEQGANFGPDAEGVPPSHRFFAGGDNSIRGFGYRDKAPAQVDGSGLKGGRYLTTGTAEVQFPIGIANSRLAVFLDGGMATDDYQDDILWGPGIGYRFISPYGIVRVDIAAGLEPGQDNNYQLHFAFGPEF